MRGSQDERRPNPTKGTRPPLPTDRERERDVEGGGINWRGELVVRVGFGD